MARKKKEPPVEDIPETPEDESTEEVVEGEEGEEEAAAEEVPAEEAAPPAPEDPADPKKHWFIHMGGNAYKRMTLAEVDSRPRSRTIEWNGQTYEHTHDHQGCWAYRHLG